MRPAGMSHTAGLMARLSGLSPAAAGDCDARRDPAEERGPGQRAAERAQIPGRARRLPRGVSGGGEDVTFPGLSHVCASRSERPEP
jgi:hypothetical protein